MTVPQSPNGMLRFEHVFTPSEVRGREVLQPTRGFVVRFSEAGSSGWQGTATSVPLKMRTLVTVPGPGFWRAGSSPDSVLEVCKTPVSCRLDLFYNPQPGEFQLDVDMRPHIRIWRENAFLESGALKRQLVFAMHWIGDEYQKNDEWRVNLQGSSIKALPRKTWISRNIYLFFREFRVFRGDLPTSRIKSPSPVCEPYVSAPVMLVSMVV